MNCNSSNVKTFPKGLCGVLTIIPFVFSLKRLSNSSLSNIQSAEERGPFVRFFEI